MGGSNVLPRGLVLGVVRNNNGITCQITGAPVEVSDSRTYTITATNEGGTQEGITVTIEVGKADDTSFAFPMTTFVATVGDEPSVPQLASGKGDGAVTYAVLDSTSMSMPRVTDPIATVDDGTGTVGEVTVKAAGTVIVQAAITGSTNYNDATATYTLIVQPAPGGDLANAEERTYALRADSSGVAIDPIVFVNSGAAMTDCTVSPTLPAGLSVGVSDDDTCEITGAPTVAITATIYTIAGTNSRGANMATVVITVVAVEDFPDFDISGSEATGLASGNFYSVVYSEMGDFTDTATSNNAAHAKVQWSASSGVTMVNYQAAAGVGRFQVTQSADPTVAAPVNLGDYAEGYVAFDINVPNYGNYTSMVVKSNSADVDDAVQNLGQVGHGAWQTIFFPVTEYADEMVDLAAVTTVFVIYPDEETQDQTTPEALSFMIRNIRWTNTKPSLGSGAPALADIAGTRTFAVGVEITPITFTNSGGDVQANGCTLFSSQGSGSTSLGQSFRGLTISVFSGTCQITGTPTGAARFSYFMRATSGSDTDDATVAFEIVVVAPELSAITGMQSYTVGTPITAISFGNMGGDVTSCTVSSGQGTGKDELPAGLSVAPVNGTCQIMGTPTSVPSNTDFNEYRIDGMNFGGTSTASVRIDVAAAGGGG